MGKIVKKDLGNFVQTNVETRHKIICEQRVTNSMRPTQVNLRLPGDQVDWLNRHVKSNKNYVISKILAKAIKELNEKLGSSDFNIDDYD